MQDLEPTVSLINPSINFKLFKSSLSMETVRARLLESFSQLALTYQLVVQEESNKLHLTLADGHTFLTVELQYAPLQTRTVLAFSPTPSAPVEILVKRTPGEVAGKLAEVLSIIDRELTEIESVFSEKEFRLIRESMPLLEALSPANASDSPFADFALIWRDHFLEENVALLHAFERAGLSPNWIYALSKGDRTANHRRVDAYFRHRGYYVDLLDSNYANGRIEKAETERITADLTEFTDSARNAGKQVFIVDDGGILLTSCFRHRQSMFAYVIEATLSGTKRLLQLPGINVPVFDAGQSQLKKIVTYPEIAESGVMRVREAIRAEKLRGRPVLVLGYGASGRQVARVFRSLGCRVSVVDKKLLPLIEAGENGFRTFSTVLEAIEETKPLLVFGCTGEVAMSMTEFLALPNGAYVTAIATKDLSILHQKTLPFRKKTLPNFGYEYTTQSGKVFYQLGDGRSFNLFHSEAIPNKANDVFKSSTFVVAQTFATSYKQYEGGIYVDEVDDAIEASGLLELYYERYLREA